MTYLDCAKLMTYNLNIMLVCFVIFLVTLMLMMAYIIYENI